MKGQVTLKKGRNVRDQAEYATILDIGPPILHVDEDAYTMHTGNSKHARTCPALTIQRTVSRLKERVWTRPLPNNDWREHFWQWSLKQPVNPMPVFAEAYIHEPPAEQVMIHGDPTLSNVLYAPGIKDIWLIDPLRPIGKIPGYVEVDIGKMLQSVVGWEHVAFDWDEPEEYVLATMLNEITDKQLKLGCLWLGVHVLRILPYATGRSNVRVKRWALEVADTILTKWNGEDPCTMLMTLMALSRTHGER